MCCTLLLLFLLFFRAPVSYSSFIVISWKIHKNKGNKNFECNSTNNTNNSTALSSILAVLSLFLPVSLCCPVRAPRPAPTPYHSHIHMLLLLSYKHIVLYVAAADFCALNTFILLAVVGRHRCRSSFSPSAPPLSLRVLFHLLHLLLHRFIRPLLTH